MIKEDSRPLEVSIRCAVYNQEPYLRQCLEGIVMQQTNFRFEAIVHDDASTDGSAAIIREYENKYPNIIKAIYEKENQYSKHDGSLCRIMDSALKGKYIAVCEGDDYWIDPLKLQKQFDFLETHKDYSLVCTRAYKLGKKLEKIIDKETDFSLRDLLLSNKISHLTVMYTQVIYQRYLNDINPYDKQWPMEDYPMILYVSYNSRIARLNDFTSVYRIVDSSATHFKRGEERRKYLFSLAETEIKIFFSEMYGEEDLLLSFKMKRTKLELKYKLWKGEDISNELMYIKEHKPYDMIFTLLHYTLKFLPGFAISPLLLCLSKIYKQVCNKCL